MSVLKILNFTADSSLLNKFKNQQSAQQIAQEAAQQTASQIQQTNPLQQTSQSEQQEQTPENKNNHITRNISIGVGAALALITLGVTGRKGYLGKGIQKFLGGAEKKSKNITDDVITHSETRSSKPGSSNIPEAELVKFRNNINAQLDRTVPNITEPLRIEVPKLPENFEELEKLAKEAKGQGITSVEHNGTRYNIIKDKDNNLLSLISDKRILVFEPETGELKLDNISTRGLTIRYENNKIQYITKDVGNNSWFYTEKGELTTLRQAYIANGKSIAKCSSISPDGYINGIAHINKTDKIGIKDDFYDNNGRLIGENFYDDAGNIIEAIEY